jgi:hypothetical protein
MAPTATLPEYQQHLLSRKLVPEKNVSSYYAHWVSLYLAFSKRLENMDKVDMLPRFLEDLQSRQHLADWQVQQAREAVQLYMGQFLKGEGDEVSRTSVGVFDLESVLARMREAIRIKHSIGILRQGLGRFICPMRWPGNIRRPPFRSMPRFIP